METPATEEYLLTGGTAFICHSEEVRNSGSKPLRTICSEMLPGTTATEDSPVSRRYQSSG
jgi:hypothetical protein